MKKILLTAIVTLCALQPLSIASQPATVPSADMLTISGTVTVDNPALYTWLRDDVCTIGFHGYEPRPTLAVLDADNVVVGSVELAEIAGTGEMVPLTQSEIDDLEETLGEGNLDRTDRLDTCSIGYEVEVPALDAYRIVIDPVFDETLSAQELNDADHVVDIEIEFDESDQLPSIRERPGGAIPGTDTYRIAGTLTLEGEWGSEFMILPLLGCEGLRGYSDIKPGAQIVVKDASGTIIQTARLEDPGMTVDTLDTCHFYFTADVEESAFYTIELGRRGSMTYSFDELNAADWHVDLVLGS